MNLEKYASSSGMALEGQRRDIATTSFYMYFQSAVRLWMIQLLHVFLHFSKENFQKSCLHFEDEKVKLRDFQ